MKTRYSFAAIASAAALGILYFSQGRASATLQEGQAMPALTVKTTDGKTFNLAKQKGKVVLVDFWATWCPPCKQEIPHLQKLHAKYGRKGLRVVGISAGEGKGKPAMYAKEQKLTYAIGYSEADEAGKLGRTFDFASIPTTYIVDKKGVIRLAMSGFGEGMEKRMEQTIKKLLAEK